MTKITLQDLTSLTNEQSALNLINNNNTVIETKSDTFLSRDGAAPNQMLADIDMNSKRILNLPAPVDGTEPLRKKDVPDNQQIGDISGAVEDAQQAAAVATAAALSASNSATNAATNADKLVGTSTTSNNITLGSKTFTTQSGKFFDEGIWLLITSNANEANYMHGVSTAYTGTTLTFNVTNVGGVGTFTDWTIRLSGTQGARGDQGLTGPPGATGGSFFPVARAIATSPVNILTDLETGDVIDGVTLANGDVVLLAGQASPAQNGIYTVQATGGATRTANYTTYASMTGAYIAVQEGAVYADTLWQCTSNPGGTIDVTALLFQQYALGKNYTIAEKNQMTANIGFTQSAVDVTASSTTDLETNVSGWTVNIIGPSTTINSIVLSPGRSRTVRFITAQTLVNNVNLVLPGGTNISVLAGDHAVFQGTPGGIVRCVDYMRSDGSPLKAGSFDTTDVNANVRGSILYRDATAWASRQPAPVAQQRILTSLGTGTDPAWDQVDLLQGVKNKLPVANIVGTPSPTTFLRGDGSWVAPSGAGDVVGPTVAIADCVATYNGTSGKIIKDSAVSLASASMGRLSGIFSFNDTNTNEMLRIQSQGASAVNEVTIANATAGNRPIVAASGNDTNIELILLGKGTGGTVVQGTQTNNNAPAGYVGEVLVPVTEALQTLTTNAGQQVGTITLTPGDWDVKAAVVFAMGGPSDYMIAAIHDAPNAVNSDAFGYAFYTGYYHSIGFPIFLGAQSPTVHIVGGRIQVATGTTKTIYLNAQCGFTGTMQAIGRFTARRMR